MSPNEKDIINTYLNHARGVLSLVFSQAFLRPTTSAVTKTVFSGMSPIWPFCL